MQHGESGLVEEHGQDYQLGRTIVGASVIDMVWRAD